jgi:hypothetical protein
MRMIKSVSKYCSLKRLQQIQDDNCIGATGDEFNELELEEMILEKRMRQAEEFYLDMVKSEFAMAEQEQFEQSVTLLERRVMTILNNNLLAYYICITRSAIKHKGDFMMFRRAVTTEQLKNNFPAIFAESEKDTLSDKYLYIPTYKLMEGLEKQGFQVVGAKQSRSRTNSAEHAKHVVYLSHKSLDHVSALLNPGTHNRVDSGEFPMLALTNSHNGLSSFAIDTAFFRLVCSNGLMMPTTSMSSARIVHKQGMQDDVIEAAYSVVQSFPEQIKQIEAMKQTELNRDEQILLAESAQNIVFDQEQIELNNKLGRQIAPRLLTVRRHADAKPDLWSTFNVIQENVIKGGIRIVSENEKGQRTFNRTRAVNSIDRDAKLNKELMQLAQKMMELKSGVAA